MPLYTVSMPDNVDRRAVFYGPTILAGTFGTEKRKMGDIPVFVSEEKSLTNYIKRLVILLSVLLRHCLEDRIT